MDSYKILICGDVGGNFQQLYKRVSTVNKSNGPFNLLLCIGAFFEPFSISHDADQHQQQSLNDNNTDKEILFPKELQSYKDNIESIPIPTYFITYTSTDYKYIEKFSNDNGEICKNLTYLGKSGIKDLLGLNIAYLSGKVDYPIKDQSNDKMIIIKSEIDELINDCENKRVDIFLSNQWARGVLNNVQSAAIPTFLKTPYKIGMDSIKQVVQSINPAYHFSKNSFYFQRPPYLNHSNDTKITRFLSLAPIYNDKKEKYLFAMNYQPNKEILTNDSTPNPFERKQQQNNNNNEQPQKKQRNNEEGSTTNFFFGNNVNIDQTQQNNNQKKRQFNNNGQHHERHYKKFEKHQREKPKPQQPCWFCLSSPDVDSHLVVTIANDCYLAFPKGGINDDHSLIVFIEHKANYISLEKSEREDVDRMIETLREFFDKKHNKDIVVFERNSFLKGAIAHGHLQVIPIDKSFGSEKIKSKFLEYSKNNNMEFKKLLNTDNIDQILNDKYFLLILPNGEKLYSNLPTKSDFQFGRKVMVDLLGIPEKLNWKDCTLSKDQETDQTTKFRDEFQPFYDEKNPSNNDDNDE